MFGFNQKPKEIVKYPDPRLLQPSTPVRNLEEGLQVVTDLRLTAGSITWGRLAGLAAPQIGINKRVFLAEGKAYINPEVLWTPNGTKYHKEGCYSLENERYDYGITRPYAVKIRWTDEEGNVQEERFNGHMAQVILHEMDHLEGRLCNGADKDSEGR